MDDHPVTTYAGLVAGAFIIFLVILVISLHSISSDQAHKIDDLQKCRAIIMTENRRLEKRADVYHMFFSAAKQTVDEYGEEALEKYQVKLGAILKENLASNPEN